jgi:hypothetical protein
VGQVKKVEARGFEPARAKGIAGLLIAQRAGRLNRRYTPSSTPLSVAGVFEPRETAQLGLTRASATFSTYAGV